MAYQPLSYEEIAVICSNNLHPHASASITDSAEIVDYSSLVHIVTNILLFFTIMRHNILILHRAAYIVFYYLCKFKSLTNE